MKNCKHNHECEQCIRESISKKEQELAELKKKLPYDRHVTIIERNYFPNYVPVPYYQPQYWLTTQGNSALQAGNNVVAGLSAMNMQSNSIALAQLQ